jgi:hypothetical protein
MVVTLRGRRPEMASGPATWAAPGRIKGELTCRASGYCWVGELTCV